MKNLIEALQIFSKYGNPLWPIYCEHEELIISPDITPSMVSEEDTKRLEELGFSVSGNYFSSYRFGSC